MLSGKAVGKGLNIKGKSAKLNRMAGVVPYLQNSKDDHRKLIEPSDPAARLTAYYTTEVACENCCEEGGAMLDEASHLGTTTHREAG